MRRRTYEILDIITRKVETLLHEKQIEMLNIIAFLQTRQLPVGHASEPITARISKEIEAFFRAKGTGLYT